MLTGGTVYLTAGLFNDSIIGTSVVFWTLMGLAVGLLVRTEKNEHQSSVG